MKTPLATSPCLASQLFMSTRRGSDSSREPSFGPFKFAGAGQTEADVGDWPMSDGALPTYSGNRFRPAALSGILYWAAFSCIASKV